MASALGQTMRVIAVARALRDKGHEVKVVAGGKLLQVIKNHRLDVIELPPLPEVPFPLDFMREQAEGLPEERLARMKELLQPLAEAEREAAAAMRPDVMLCGNFTGPRAAKLLNIPYVMIFLQPHGANTINFFMQRLSRLEAIKQQIYEVMSSASLLILEGFPELSGDAGLESYGEGAGLLKDRLHFSGPLLAEPPQDLPGKEELKARHAGNKEMPLIYVTIGGGTPLIGEDFLTLVLDAFRRLENVKGVISTGLAVDLDRIMGGSPPDNVYIRSFVPGTELVKASEVTVFHGGSSTLMTCIACGTPAVVVPSMAEQEDNGAVLARYGAGIVLNKKDLTANALADAIQGILKNPAFRDRAQELKALGEKYGGAPGAAARVEELIKRGRPG